MEISLIQNIQNLSCDLQRKILSYTYSPQPQELLYDIETCKETLDSIKEYYFH